MSKLEQLRMFVQSAESGSFSACARKLGKAQSAVSQGIANLELDLAVEIFDRSTRKPCLTPEGQRLLSYARIVLQQAEEFDAAAKAILRQEEAAIKIALEDSLQMPAFSRLLFEFSQVYRNTEVEILSVASPDVIGLVESGRVDVGLMLSDMAFNRQVDLCYIGNIELHAVCAPTHPLSQLPSVEIAHVAAYTQMILRGEGGGELDHEASISALKWASNNVHCLVEMIAQGNGWGYLPSHLISEHIKAGRLIKLPMRLDDKPWRPPVDMVLPKGVMAGPGLNWLIAGIKRLLD